MTQTGSIKGGDRAQTPRIELNEPCIKLDEPFGQAIKPPLIPSQEVVVLLF